MVQGATKKLKSRQVEGVGCRVWGVGFLPLIYLSCKNLIFSCFCVNSIDNRYLDNLFLVVPLTQTQSVELL